MIRNFAIQFRLYCVDYSALRGQTLAFRGHDTDNAVIPRWWEAASSVYMRSREWGKVYVLRSYTSAMVMIFCMLPHPSQSLRNVFRTFGSTGPPPPHLSSSEWPRDYCKHKHTYSTIMLPTWCSVLWTGYFGTLYTVDLLPSRCGNSFAMYLCEEIGIITSTTTTTTTTIIIIIGQTWHWLIKQINKLHSLT